NRAAGSHPAHQQSWRQNKIPCARRPCDWADGLLGLRVKRRNLQTHSLPHPSSVGFIVIGSGGAVSSRILASNLPAGTLKSVADFEAITQHKKEHMMRLATLSAVILIPLLVACESQAERQADLTEDRIEQQANASAVAAGSQIVALGLTEAQLLDADLVGADG